MDFFFEPKGVAVVGATPETDTVGHYLIANVILSYKGPVYPVNPKYDQILGLKCYSKVSEIDGPLDLALIIVPAPVVPQILEDCVRKGARGAIIESGGFAEIGPRGKILQDRCLDIARKGGLRLWGPNCMGLIDVSKKHVFSFMTTEVWKGTMNPGKVSLIVQSGLLSAGFITTLMGNRILGMAKVCSIGNKSDVEETELLEYLLNDPATGVIGLYLESFVDGRRFFELSSYSRKPIVVLKGGRSRLGAQAAVSHTASLAGNDQLIGGVLRQAGVHQADDLFEMVDIARTLDKNFVLQQPPGKKARIVVLSYSGASGIITADHLEKNGLTLARLSPRTVKRLKKLAPSWMPIGNPVDYFPAMAEHGRIFAYKHAIEAIHDDPEVDGLIVHLFGIWRPDTKEILSGIKKPTKPILFWLIGPEQGREITRAALEEDGWPVFGEIHRTVRVMAVLFEHPSRDGKGLRAKGCPSAKTTRVPRRGLTVSSRLRELSLQAEEQGPSILDEYEAKKWLRALNLGVVKEEVAESSAAVLRAAHRMGFPVVLKGMVEGRIHKTEAGLVRLNLSNPGQVRSGCQDMLRLKPKPQFFVVQPMLKGDLELIAGVVRDPQFGPAVMLGIGGVRAEVYRDVVFRLPPLNETDVYEMVSDLRGGILFNGYRGSKPVNMKALAGWLEKLGWLALTFEKIQEIDVNPLLVVNGEPVAVDATLTFRA